MNGPSNPVAPVAIGLPSLDPPLGQGLPWGKMGLVGSLLQPMLDRWETVLVREAIDPPFLEVLSLYFVTRFSREKLRTTPEVLERAIA